MHTLTVEILKKEHKNFENSLFIYHSSNINNNTKALLPLQIHILQRFSETNFNIFMTAVYPRQSRGSSNLN